MLRILILLAIIVALFLALPPTPAVAWSSIPFLLLGALFLDAYRRGRRLLLARNPDGEETDPAVDASRFVAGMMLFHAVWIGLDSNASAAADGAYAHGMDGGAGIGGFDAGGFDSGGGDGSPGGL